MGCPPIANREVLPLLTMVVVGPPKAGKTSLLTLLAPKQDRSMLDASTGTLHQDIASFPLLHRFRVLAFELSTVTAKTNTHYYPSAHIVLVVLDYPKVMRLGEQKKNCEILLEDIDCLVPEYCRIIVVFNKIDQNSEFVGDQTALLGLFEKLKHHTITCKVSTERNEGIDKLVEIIANSGSIETHLF